MCVLEIWEKVKNKLEEIYSAPIILFSIREAYKDEEKDVYIFRVVIAEPRKDGKYKLVSKKIEYDPEKDEIIYVGDEVKKAIKEVEKNG